MARPFWEEIYHDRTKSTFGQASREIIELAETLTGNVRILDMVCGEGWNALFRRAGVRPGYDIRIPRGYGSARN